MITEPEPRTFKWDRKRFTYRRARVIEEKIIEKWPGGDMKRLELTGGSIYRGSGYRDSTA